MEPETQIQVSSPTKKALRVSAYVAIFVFIIAPIIFFIFGIIARGGLSLNLFGDFLFVMIIFPFLFWAYILTALLLPISIGLLLEKNYTKNFIGLFLFLGLAALVAYYFFNPLKFSGA